VILPADALVLPADALILPANACGPPSATDASFRTTVETMPTLQA
jgi:hypothetical protein